MPHFRPTVPQKHPKPHRIPGPSFPWPVIARGAAVYQLEVKQGLVRFVFPPSSGWRVTVHVHPMELGQHASKRHRAAAALTELKRLGANPGPHERFGRVGLVAVHDDHGVRLVEVAGESGRQMEQALYSGLGQLLLTMKLWTDTVRYGLAVPDTRAWASQLRKIPPELTGRLNLELYLVSPTGVTTLAPGTHWGGGGGHPLPAPSVVPAPDVRSP